MSKTHGARIGLRSNLWALLMVATILASACGGSPLGPSSPSRPLVLSGQSNAQMVAPFLTAVYPASVLTVADSGRAIFGWSVTASEHWPQLVPLLQQPIQAFVWWQGESDRTNPNYLADLQDLVARVRQTNGDPGLLVVVVRVLDLSQNASVRAAQEMFVRTDRAAVLISSDGFQLAASDHLTDVGYQAVAQRILDAVRSGRRT